ncbi:MAG: Family ership [Pseudomonadota bacterium]|jgi:transcriptional regulator with XRE-family HTH domain
MDHETLAKQLIRAVRGKRSQVAVSRRLRCQSNVLYAWESGRRWPTAATFLRLALLSRVPLAERIAEFLGGLPPALASADWSEPSTAAALLEHLRGGTTIVELARRVGKNRVSVARWLQGSAEPRLPDFLRLIEGTSLRLLDFVALFTSPAELPATCAAWQVLEAQRRVAYELPWSHAVMRVLELEHYRALPAHQPGWIAARLGIDLEEEQRCLEALASSRLIRRRQRRWVVEQVLTVDTRRNPEAGRNLKRHWAEVGKQRLPVLEPGGEDLFSYNLFTIAERDWHSFRELHIAYYQELRRLVEASNPAERVVLVNLQLLRLDRG